LELGHHIAIVEMTRSTDAGERLLLE